jgi:RNA polymerase sigma-70 factor (ECF subfamily)
VPPSDDFAEFYAATFRPLTAQLHAYTGDHAEAQDMVQEAFCRAYSHWGKISGYDDPAAWVRRVAWNMAISRWRRTRRFLNFHRDLAAEPLAGPNGNRIDLAHALAQLPPQQRQAVVLHYLADLPVRDVAEFMGAAEGTVKSWLHRARTTLGVQLGLDEQEVNHA